MKKLIKIYRNKQNNTLNTTLKNLKMMVTHLALISGCNRGVPSALTEGTELLEVPGS
jgi:hypothetical protein